MTDGTDQLLTSAQLADWLQLKEKTVRNWRHLGMGPPCIKLATGSVRYRRSDVEAWMAEVGR